MMRLGDDGDVIADAGKEGPHPCCPDCRALPAGCFGIVPSTAGRRLLMRCGICGTYYQVEPKNWNSLAATTGCCFAGLFEARETEEVMP